MKGESRLVYSTDNMNDCVFCKIINKSLPSYKIYEDKEIYVFLDISKDVDGHILVIPKKHYINIMDVDNKVLQDVVKTIKLVSNHLVNNCGYSGVNILNASGTSAGQSVNHLHFHLIPRCDNDEIDAWPKFNGAKITLDEMCERLKFKE